MGEVRGVVASETEEKFRRLAMKKFGYGKGSLSKALEAALGNWIQMNDSKELDPWGFLYLEVCLLNIPILDT